MKEFIRNDEKIYMRKFLDEKIDLYLAMISKYFSIISTELKLMKSNRILFELLFELINYKV